jgi:hypothetical protein
MRKLLVAVLLVVLSSYAHAYIAGIAIQTEKSSNMQVYVNGKLFNKTPGRFVRIKSTPGLLHVEVKVLNPYDRTWYLVRKNIKVEKGFEFYYRVKFVPGKMPQLVAYKKYPVYTKYFINPSLYNRNPIS